MTNEPRYSDYATVPTDFINEVCRCSGARSFTSPENFPPAGTSEYTDKQRELYTLKFDWWVCSKCMKPAPMNALFARLIRECELCEEPYLINHYPDRMNLCDSCA